MKLNFASAIFKLRSLCEIQSLNGLWTTYMLVLSYGKLVNIKVQEKEKEEEKVNGFIAALMFIFCSIMHIEFERE